MKINLSKSVLNIVLPAEKKYLASRTVANEVLLKKTLKMHIKEVLLQWSTIFYDIRGITTKNTKNDILANELHKLIRRNSSKKKSTFYIWGVDLKETEFLSKRNKKSYSYYTL